MRTSPCRSAARRIAYRTTGLLAALFLALFAAGCGSDGDSMTGPGDDPSGGDTGGGANYSVTVNGAESFVSTGTIAWSGGSAAVNGWEVRLESLDPASPLLSLGIEGDGDRPAPGTYAIVSPQVQAAPNEFYGRCSTLIGETYYAMSGMLTITSSSDDTVEGTFAFAGEAPAGAAVSVTGSFRADDLLDE